MVTTLGRGMGTIDAKMGETRTPCHKWVCIFQGGKLIGEDIFLLQIKYYQKDHGKDRKSNYRSSQE